MSNGSNSSSSSSNSGCFGKFLALLTALGGGAGLIALLTFFKPPPDPPNPPLPPNRTTPTQPGQPPPEPPTSHPSKVNINWGNLSQYFNVNRVKFEKGFQQADSELSFVVEAKGNFSGNLIVYFYDSDGVKVCPSVLSIKRDCSLIGYAGFVKFSTKNSDNNFTFWQTNEHERISILVPGNASTVELSFKQSSF